LSQFLRDYLYISLGGNRRGRVLRYVNLLITMLLGGLWHGAAWTFVVWGALHGAYLCVNHAFNALVPTIPPPLARPVRILGAVLTFLAVVVAWVFFRAERVDWAMLILGAMADPTNIVFGREEIAALVLVSIYAALVWLAPNTQAIMGYDHGHRRVGEALRAGRIRPLFLYAASLVLAFGILGIQSHSEFIYFRF
jgi:D-alanyl-lipoteichoic acid acyltransferase DltB (MBOAT superfamily)